MENEVQYIVINSGATGPTVFITAMVHGDEPCGLNAIRMARDVLKDPRFVSHGKIVLVPVVNLDAARIGQRTVGGADFNRNFSDWSETEIVQESDPNRRAVMMRQSGMAAIFREHKSDEGNILLDLHSHLADGDTPFVMATGNEEREADLWRALGLPVWLKGDFAATTTGGLTMVGWFRENMPKARGAVVECGQHKLKSTTRHAKACLFRALQHAMVLSSEGHRLANMYLEKTSIETYKSSDVYELVAGQSVGWTQERADQEAHLPKHLCKNFVGVKKGDALLLNSDNAPILWAENDGYLIFPRGNVVKGQNYFSFAIRPVDTRPLVPEPKPQC